MSLPTPSKVEKLQTALHEKAKGSPGFRFYSLYDKVYRKDVLWDAFQRCRINGGAPGVDEQTFADITEYGEARWLDELAGSKGALFLGRALVMPCCASIPHVPWTNRRWRLRKKEYRPSPVRRVWIPKANGPARPACSREDFSNHQQR